MSGSTSPGPVTVTLHVNGSTPVTTLPTVTRIPGPAHGFLPLTGAPAVTEGTAALMLLLSGTLAVLAARRRLGRA